MIKLPAPIGRYFEAANGDAADKVAACFTAEAHVRDENHDHHGHEAILAWAIESRQKYQFYAEARSFEPSADGGTVTAHLTGDFPGAPADLRYRFRLEGDDVAELEVTTRPAAAELTGRRVLVTGGGQGIGAAVVRRLRQAGAVVFTNARSGPAYLLKAERFKPAHRGTPAGAAQVAQAGR